MIGIELQGRLGNQMFQYTAARIQASRLQCGLVVKPRGGRKIALHNCIRKRLDFELFDAFPTLTFHPLSHLFSLFHSEHSQSYQIVRNSIFKNAFVANCHINNTDANNEAYDSGLWNIGPYTWLSGYFQSPLYFTGYEERIRDWFSASPDTVKEVQQRASDLLLQFDGMIAVHVRIGDYKQQTGALADSHNGWCLTKDYYDKALSILPPGAPIALFSDDPNQAQHLLPRTPAWISTGNNAQIDLHMISLFKYVVIANSTFSWWAAWLNQNSSPTIIAPKYFIGRQKRIWFPADIRVNSWNYV